MTMSRLHPKPIKWTWALISILKIKKKSFSDDCNGQPLKCHVSLLTEVCLPVHFICCCLLISLEFWFCNMISLLKSLQWFPATQHVNSTFPSHIYSTVFHLFLTYLLLYTECFAIWHLICLSLPYFHAFTSTVLLPTLTSTYIPRMSLLLSFVSPDSFRSSRPSSNPTF